MTSSRRSVGACVSEQNDGSETDAEDGVARTLKTITQKMAFDPSSLPKRRTPSLVVVSGRSLGEIYRLGADDLTIGRDEGNFVLLDDVGVSRNHARIAFDGRSVIVEDLESKNGTFVNNAAITKRELEDGDLVHIGHTTYKYLSGTNAEHRYYEALYSVASSDPLTGLPNRRYFDDAIDREIARSKRHKTSLSLVLLDLDHFKSVNDNYGHVAGDEVLKAFASLVLERTRRNDFVARYGGEEFAMLVTDTDQKGLSVLCENIRSAVEDHRFSSGSSTIPVTVSMGAAHYGPETQTAAELIEAADRNLYRAKEAGRNQCVDS